MVVLCPKCQTKLKVDEVQALARTATFRCPRCEALFRVQKTPSVAQDETATPDPVTGPEPATAETPAAQSIETPAGGPDPSEPTGEATGPAGTAEGVVFDTPVAEEPPPPPERSLEEDIERARRLARTILSDIALYNANVIDDAVRDETFFDILGDEVREGLKLYNSRVSESVRETGDYFREATEDFLKKKRAELGIDEA